MTALFASIFAASLLGSLHCTGMCGPLVAVALGGREGARASLLAYHGGRGAAYLLLGATAGALGAALDLTGQALGLTRAAALLGGAGVLAVALLGLAKAAGLTIPASWLGSRIGRSFAAPLRLATRLPATSRALAIGGLTALLPCGWLYAFVATAAATAHPLYGAAAMGVFFLGTVPALTAVGLAAGPLAARLGAKMPVVTAAALLVLAGVTLSGRTDVLDRMVAAAQAAAPASAERSPAPSPSTRAGPPTAAPAPAPPAVPTEAPCCAEHGSGGTP